MQHSFAHTLRRRSTQLWLLFFAVAAALYLINLSGWLMHDDEGTDFYEAWQLSEGKTIGVDYVAEQQPLFLQSGRLLIDWFGRNPTPLKLLAVVQVLAGAALLAWAVRRIWGDRVAVLSIAFLLLNGPIYEQARLYRPDPMMLAWEMGGLAWALLAVQNKKPRLWVLSGLFYGISTLWKPFGLFPVVGLVFYFLVWLWQEKQAWRRIITAGLWFSLPFLGAGLGIAALLYSQTGFYYFEPFSYHAAMGSESGFWIRAGRAAFLPVQYLRDNWVFLYIPLLWWLNGRPRPPKLSPARLLGLQLLVPFAFVIISRPLHLRYLLFLIPPLSIMFARQVVIAWERMAPEARNPNRFFVFLAVCALLLTLPGTKPFFPYLLTRAEEDTRKLAEFVRENTAPTDLVLTDYAGINFFAERLSIYEASIIAGAQIREGIVTTEMLIDRIENEPVAMVIVHLEEGLPAPHHLVELDDFPGFIDYLETHFGPPIEFIRDGQMHAIYQR